MIGQLIVASAVGLDGNGVGPRPVFPVDDGCEQPAGVGLVVDGQLPALLAPHRGSEVEGLGREELH